VKVEKIFTIHSEMQDREVVTRKLSCGSSCSSRGSSD